MNMLVRHTHNTSTSNQLVFVFPTPYSIRVLEGWHSGKDSNLESRFWRPMVSPLTNRCILLSEYISGAEGRIRTHGRFPASGFQDRRYRPLSHLRILLVGQVGVEPTTPEENGFTARRVCRFATDPCMCNYTMII